MAFEVSAKIHQILDKMSGQGRNGVWEKQDFVLETQENYPKKICISVWGDKISTLSNYKPGDDVKVSFDVESREYNGKWFTNLKAWRTEGNNPNKPASQSSDFPPPPSIDDLPPEPENGGDLPF